MTSETTELDTEKPNYNEADYDWLPVRDAVTRLGVSEKTIYNRIDDGLYKRKKESGRTYVGIKKKAQREPEPISESPREFTEAFTESTTETDSEVFHGEVLNRSETGDLISFMRETMHKVAELSEENGRYKALTDMSSKTAENMEREIEQLRAQIFERDARIKELEQKQPDLDLQSRIKQLEAQLAERDEKIKALEAAQAEKKGGLFGLFRG